MPNAAQQVRIASEAEAPCVPLPLDPSESSAPLGNRIVASLPPHEFKRLRRHLQPLWLLGGEVVTDRQAAVFPVQAILSLRTRHVDGCTVEFASVGREGCIGFELADGEDSAPTQAIASTAGLAYLLPAEQLAEEYGRQGTLARLLHRQAKSVLAQAAILCACNRRHALEQQLARWLLASFDRLQGNELIVTQEIIASLLGVRREGVTEAARRLQRDCIIEYRRGHVFLLRRDGLAARACECYAAIRHQLERSFLPPGPPSAESCG